MNFKTLVVETFVDERLEVENAGHAEALMINQAIQDLAFELIKSDCIECYKDYDVARQGTRHSFRVRVLVE